MLSVKFVERRAHASRDVQDVIPGPTGRSREEWDADIDRLEKLQGIERRQHAQLRRAAARWEKTLQQIQKITRDVKRRGRFRFQDDPVRLHLVTRLRADGRSRTSIYDQGLAAHAAWLEAEPAAPLSHETTVNGFRKLLQRAAVCQRRHTGKQTALRTATAALMAHARGMDRRNTAWFDLVTRRFPVDTAEGHLIRSLVPTTTRPRKSRAKVKPILHRHGTSVTSQPVEVVVAVHRAA